MTVELWLDEGGIQTCCKAPRQPNQGFRVRMAPRGSAYTRILFDDFEYETARSSESVSRQTSGPGGLGLLTCYERLARDCASFMAGSRKFSVEHICRSDPAALTPEAAAISGIPAVLELIKWRWRT